jgi:hypothetical protein
MIVWNFLVLKVCMGSSNLKGHPGALDVASTVLTALQSSLHSSDFLCYGARNHEMVMY